jgi:hypothetical protein
MQFIHTIMHNRLADFNVMVRIIPARHSPTRHLTVTKGPPLRHHSVTSPAYSPLVPRPISKTVP